jgi:hypothetical protein
VSSMPDGGRSAHADQRPLERALIEEALRKSAMLWIELPSLPAPRAAWHVWVDGAAVVVHEGGEQSLAGLEKLDTVPVTVRSKDKGGLLVELSMRVVTLTPDDPRWNASVTALHAARQSPPDGENQPARWASQSKVTRLEPTSAVAQAPGRYDDSGRRAEPVPTPATTLDQLPRVVGRRSRRRPRL